MLLVFADYFPSDFRVFQLNIDGYSPSKPENQAEKFSRKYFGQN